MFFGHSISLIISDGNEIVERFEVLACKKMESSRNGKAIIVDCVEIIVGSFGFVKLYKEGTKKYKEGILSIAKLSGFIESVNLFINIFIYNVCNILIIR